MDKFPINNTNDTDTTAQDIENVGHTGNAPGTLQERPVEIFDNTPLDQAVADNLITTPDSAQYLTEATPVTPEKKKRRGVIAGIGAGVVGLLVVGGLAMGLNNNNDNGPKGGPVAEAPVDPGEEVPFGEEPANPVDPEVSGEEPEVEAPAAFEVAGLPTLAELEIAPGQTDNQVAESLVKLSSDWSMAGANKEMYDLQFEGDNGYLSLEDYVTKITDATDPIYVQAIYGENATNPQFADAIALQKEQHRQVLMAHFQTYGNQNTAPYYQKENFSQLQEAIKHEDGTTTMFVTMIREDNGADNIVEGSGNGNITRATYITAEVDGKIKLVQPPAYVLQ